MRSFFRNSLDLAVAQRVLRTGDAMECSRLHATSFAHSWSAADFEVFLSDPSCSGEGVEAKSGLVGFVLSRQTLDEAEVLTLVVAPPVRRKGCGRRLLAAHLARLAARGVKNLFLEVDETNQAALELYRRFSFSVEGRRKDYYAKDHGKRSDALMMRRALS